MIAAQKLVRVAAMSASLNLKEILAHLCHQQQQPLVALPTRIWSAHLVQPVPAVQLAHLVQPVLAVQPVQLVLAVQPVQVVQQDHKGSTASLGLLSSLLRILATTQVPTAMSETSAEPKHDALIWDPHVVQSLVDLTSTTALSGTVVLLKGAQVVSSLTRSSAEFA